MRVTSSIKSLLLGSAATLLIGHLAGAATTLADGDQIAPLSTPTAAFTALNPHIPGYPNYTAGQAISTAISPDGRTLLILTSGYNLLEDSTGANIPAASNEYVFVYNIANDQPVQAQVLTVPNTYVGIAFAPDGKNFYVSGGVSDDIHTYAYNNGLWAESGTPIALGHKASSVDPIDEGGVGIEAPPEVASIAVTANGKQLVADNFYNDSISIITLATGAIDEVQLRPGLINPANTGKPGGEYPFGVAIKGNDIAFVSSVRDREIDVVRLTGTPKLVERIKVPGNPLKEVLNKEGTLLYVATDNADAVEVIDTKTDKVVQSIPTVAPPGMLALSEQYRGVDPNSLALSPDEKTLYVTNGGTNSLAVIDLTQAQPVVTGLIPTGDYPNAVSISHDGVFFYVVNGRSTPGPNPNYCSTNGYSASRYALCAASNQYILQLSKAGFLSGVLPQTAASLAKTTQIVANNDHFAFMPSAYEEKTMAFLHQHIKHIIYIIRENRTYDQMLGDLGEGNGDPSLAEFGNTDAPNAHNLATNFVDLDNFYDVGEVSGNGWPWSTTAHESDMGAKNLSVNYAGRGLTYDWEGTNRNVDIAIATLKGREEEEPLYAAVLPDAADVLPGTANIAAPDSPTGIPERGYLWDAALRAGLTVRNYGFLLDLDRYELPVSEGGIAEVQEPYATKYQVAFSANPTLIPLTDPYFRGFDTAFPDYYREAEWEREFTLQIKNNNMPNLTLVRLMHDHLGTFSTAIDGVNTPETQIADNDYAVGRLIDTVAHSPYASSTLIFVIEDDAQDGADHVDAHRSEAFIVGPYVKHHAIVSDHYSTVNFLRTMEDILGIDHLSIHDAYQKPMADVFDPAQTQWTYTATVPAPLGSTSLPVSSQAMLIKGWHNSHPADYWAALTKGYDWSKEDDIPTAKFNLVLWRGLMGNRPYPTIRNGIDYSKRGANGTTSAALETSTATKAD